MEYDDELLTDDRKYFCKL